MEYLIICGFVLIFLLALEWCIRQLKIGDYQSRYVLITGCDSGFGNMLAKQLDELKLSVFACCLTKSAVENFRKTSSSKLKAIEMDVTKDASIEKAMEIVKRTLPEGKGLWAVVNNAGIFGGIGSIHLHSRKDYEETLAVNLYGVIMVTKACIPLVVQEKGRFVNISSVLGKLAGFSSSYSISKYGVEAFSDILRRELYRTGVKVQIIEPGAFKTPIWGRGNLLRMAEEKVASLPADVRAQLPDDAVEKLDGFFRSCMESASPNIQPVVDAYLHSITAKFPRKRYLVGTDAKKMRLVWNLPECLSDLYADVMGFTSI